ncbi:hydantoinase/oxoprolinase family protein [Thermomicrobium sp. 4228-Ro]|uniref:hydantoinase/oxoprolinase family protein n=1 Tax=Thermomicrobium sp. 4228-Ro TaxID=2993937 RepID=UPI0022499CBE|nr:hydantoinase/oxoprolinase family protein [Thermomicrobium sp. 4228-Ro]MCX2728476.1 hydantoinase/oxoprolinase family protein [Thermomicrobium sp. 4228-Ro]
MVRVGVDTGGTFTDFVVIDGEGVRIHKEPSTPRDPAQAIVTGLRALGVWDRLERLIHGTTVATNAFLERKGARTGLLTTAGFRDVLEIGRQNRPRLYDLRQVREPPLVPRQWRLEVRERLDPQGEIVVPLHDEDVEAAIEVFRAAGIESVAVSFLFSFVNPEHERRAASLLREAGFAVSASHEVSPEYREYERTSTTVVNAYVSPVMGQYLKTLAETLPGRASLWIMQSNGGTIGAEVAARQAVRTLLSGPAAGVIGARAIARAAGFRRVISFDMGGTSTDVCLIDGEPRERTEGRIGELPVRIPMLDIHTVGAGGGSIAWFDEGGALRVGPRSAGADPGPAAYGRGGDEPTVTDAAVVLGWLLPDAFLGGTMRLDAERAREVIWRVARRLGRSLEEAALGIVEVAEANMERAIRVVSVERGEDPREYGLVAFGGAGPMVACALASKLHIPIVLIPHHPGTLSALGLLTAPSTRDYVRTVMLPANRTHPTLETVVADLTAAAIHDLAEEGLVLTEATFQFALDLRYSGQSYELTVPFTDSLSDAVQRFHQAHEQLYGYADPAIPVTIVNIRLRVTLPPAIEMEASQRDALTLWEPEPLEMRHAAFSDGTRWSLLATPRFERAQLMPGAILSGPALVTQYDTTTVIPPDWRGIVDATGTIVLQRHGEPNDIVKLAYGRGR